MKNRILEIEKRAKIIDHRIESWDHQGNPDFLYAVYPSDGPLGKVIGINLNIEEIVFS